MSEPLKLKLDGAEYDLVLPDDMTMGEQRAFERIAECSADALVGLGDRHTRNATVLVAWLAVSIHRAKPQTPISQIVDRLDQIKPAELAGMWENLGGQSPPRTRESSTGSGESGKTTSGDSSASSAAPPASTTPNGSGGPGSVTTSESRLATSPASVPGS